MSTKQTIPAVTHSAPRGDLPPVPGSQSDAEPVITETQRKRKGAPILAPGR